MSGNSSIAWKISLVIGIAHGVLSGTLGAALSGMQQHGNRFGLYLVHDMFLTKVAGAELEDF